MKQQEYFKASIEEFEQIFEIMDESFPDNEMRTRQDQYSLMTSSECYNIICFGCDDENINGEHIKAEVAGFIVVWELPSLIFIENFATTKNMRGKGLGGDLLDYVIEHYKKDVILEVEPADDEMKERRILFYKRHGFVLNDFDYEMPPLRKDDSPLPLKIMSYNKSFTKDSFEAYKKQIYNIVYEVEL